MFYNISVVCGSEMENAHIHVRRTVTDLSLDSQKFNKIIPIPTAV
jgi:hypothetical protein